MPLLLSGPAASIRSLTRCRVSNKDNCDGGLGIQVNSAVCRYERVGVMVRDGAWNDFAFCEDGICEISASAVDEFHERLAS